MKEIETAIRLVHKAWDSVYALSEKDDVDLIDINAVCRLLNVTASFISSIGGLAIKFDTRAWEPHHTVSVAPPACISLDIAERQIQQAIHSLAKGDLEGVEM